MKTNSMFIVPLLLTASLSVRAEPPASAAPVATAAATATTAHTAASVNHVAAAKDVTTISIHEFMFAPTSMTVPVGTTVKWKNLDGEPHTVRSIDATFSSNALDQDDTFAFKFDKPGTYRYVCSIHPQMVGTVVVKAAK